PTDCCHTFGRPKERPTDRHQDNSQTDRDTFRSFLDTCHSCPGTYHSCPDTFRSFLGTCHSFQGTYHSFPGTYRSCPACPKFQAHTDCSYRCKPGFPTENTDCSCRDCSSCTDCIVRYQASA